MSDSLNVAGFELIGGSTAFRLAPGFTFGDAAPDQTSIAQLILDGEVIVGDRTHNRTFAIPVEVFAASRSDLTAQVDGFAQALNVPSGTTFTVVWTPNGGQPIIFDCYRATVIRTRDLVRDAQFGARLDVTFQAGPFGRSSTTQTIAVGGTTLQLDSFDTAATGGTLTTTVKYEGTGSNKVTEASHVVPTVSRTLASTNLSTYNAVTVRMRIDSVANGGGFSFTLTLSSAGGSTTYVNNGGYQALWTGWLLMTFSLTDASSVAGTTGSGVNLAAVTGYSLSGLQNSGYGTYTGSVYFDDLRAWPPSSASITTTQGLVANAAGVIGSARTPVALAVTGSASITGLLLHSPPPTQDPDVGILQALNTSLSNQTVTIAAANANFDGTYAVWLLISSSNAGAQSVTVTVTQLENGTSVASQALSLAYTGAVTGRFVYAGNVTLPLAAVPLDNTLTTFTVQVQRTAGADTWSDLALCDTQGQTVNLALSTGVAVVYVEQPDPFTGFGQMLGTATDRTAAYSVLGSAFVTGGPIVFEPGTNKLLAVAASTAAPVAITNTLYPRWLDERVQ